MTNEERVRKVISYQLGIETATVTDEKRFTADLGSDSLDDIELVMALEDEFGVSIDDDDAARCRTVGEAIALINTLVSA